MSKKRILGFLLAFCMLIPGISIDAVATAAEPTNVALATNGTTITSNRISGFGEENDLGLDEMIDGVGSNYGITEGCDKDDETTLDLIFKQSYAVSKVRMRVRELSTDPVYATAPVDYTLSVWTANGWKAVVKVEDHVQSKSNEWIEHEFEAVACRAVRLSVTEHGCDGGNTYAIYLREFEAYGIPTEEVVATPPAQGMFYNVTATIYDAREGQYGIVWHSTKNLAEPKIQVVSEKDKNNFDESLGEYDVTVSSSEGYYIYKGIISGLEASTCYYYRVGDTSVNLFSEWGSFVTSSLDESAFTFFHMTDTQNYYSQWNTVLSSAFSLYDDAKLIVHTGDLVEWGPDAGEWKTAFDTTKDYLSNTLLTSIAGSHHESQGTELYDHFNFKVPNSQDPDGGLYYSYDYNNVHFTMIDINDYSSESEQLSPTQIQWLIQDLKNTDKEWKVVGLHWSMYSAGLRLNFAEIAAIRAQLEPIFSEYNVDLVLSGHDHVYTRTYPIKNGAVVQDIETSLVTIGGKETSFDVNPNGTVYLLSNTSGGTFYELKYSGEWFSAKDGQPNQSMFSAITVDGDKLIINAYTVDQNTGATQLYDTYAMMKTKIESDDDLKDDETTDCDKTQLNSAIESAKALKRGDYTKDSYEVLKAALVKAEAVFQNSEATQAVVDEATTQLLVAIDKLVKKELPVLDSQENESQKAEPPATGDNNNLGVLFLVAFLAVMGISVVIDNKRRRNS